MHEATAMQEATNQLTALDYIQAGSRGARIGASFGLVGAAGGAIVFAAGLYAWDRWHDDILNAVCG
jgi:hypothetical protein